MKEYAFTVILEGVDVMTEEIAESLYSVADDASACSSGGIAKVHFDRESDSFDNAIRSAIADVRQSGHKVKEVRQDKDDLQGLLVDTQ